jgi:hypothetical protein
LKIRQSLGHKLSCVRAAIAELEMVDVKNVAAVIVALVVCRRESRMMPVDLKLHDFMEKDADNLPPGLLICAHLYTRHGTNFWRVEELAAGAFAQHKLDAFMTAIVGAYDGLFHGINPNHAIFRSREVMWMTKPVPLNPIIEAKRSSSNLER